MSFPQPSNDTASQYISSSAAPSIPRPIATAVEKHDSSPDRESEASFAISASTSQLTNENMLSGSAIVLFTPPIILQKGIFRGKQMRYVMHITYP